jgi:hypothetical protein
MRTIEQNFKKHPHTARFLLAFHSAGGTNLGGGVLASDVEPETDLLDLVDAEAAVDVRTPGQRDLMARLVAQIAELDAELAAKTEKYIAEKSAAGAWVSPGRDGDVSAWIDKMIAKVRELKATAVKPGPSTGQAIGVANGRYAVEHQGVLKFFHIRNGKADTRWAGFVFVDVQASDEIYPIKNRATKAEVLALIAADPETAMNRYGQELGVCGDCGRTLTDETSRSIGRGPICRSK